MRLQVLVIAVVSVICSVGSVLAAYDGFDAAPPTRGIERNTAHTLHAKELQIGFLFSEVLQDAYVEVGVSDSLNMGLAVLTTLGGQPYGWLSTSDHIGDKLLMGTFTGLRFRPEGWFRPNYLYGQTGFCFGMAATADTALHIGLDARFRLNLDVPRVDYVEYSPYVIVSAEISEEFLLLGEITQNPTRLRVGFLMRVWDVVALRVTADPVSLSAQFGVEARIGIGGER